MIRFSGAQGIYLIYRTLYVFTRTEVSNTYMCDVCNDSSKVVGLVPACADCGRTRVSHCSRHFRLVMQQRHCQHYRIGALKCAKCLLAEK